MKLYELTQNYMNLQALLEDETISQDLIDAAMKEVGEDIEEKAQNYAVIMKNLEAEADALEKEEKRLAARKSSLKNRNKILKDNLENSMKAIGKTKFKTNLFSFNICKNPSSVNIDDENLIPDQYIVYTKSVAKKAILDDIKQGVIIPGVSLKQTESLKIR
ncbi:siphovirus Gp157 family protein [Clostridium sp. C2-6-12]|uniref:siphovirus Gp157 family protein n=1 Tax=Clostridium sp. C2-6-12 TaxID=2698832 RepID=UPI00136E086F|nr:siphovirus Gp157 family protein [Clostridium sp. C2-6-12]